MKTLPDDFPRITKEIKNGVQKWRVNDRSVNFYPIGKQKWFTNEKDAKRYQQQVRDTLQNFKVSMEDSFIVQNCNRVLKAYGVDMTIQEVVNVYCKKYHKKNQMVSITIETAYDLYWKYKTDPDTRDKELRPSTESEINTCVGRFVKKFGPYHFEQIGPDEIRKYLSQFKNLQTRRNNRRSINTFFEWGKSRKFILNNPFDEVTNPGITFVEPQILKIEKVKEILRTVKSDDPELMPFVALGFFCGIRPVELSRLDESDFDFESGYINIPAKKAKDKRSRLVPLTETLRSFMPKYASINVMNLAKRFDKIKVKCGYQHGKHEGMPWPADVLRHSFASYHLAVHKSRAELAEIMGNSEKIIKKHYRTPIKQEVGEAYFALRIDNLDEPKD